MSRTAPKYDDADRATEREPSHAALPRGPHHLTAEEVVENQRTRMIEALIELIGWQGYSAISVAGVVERSGVSRRSFYELFSNLAELLKAAFNESTDTVLQQMTASLVRAGEGPLPRLEALARPLCRAAHDQPGRTALWSVEIVAAPEGPRLREDVMDRGAKLLQQAIGTNEGAPAPYTLAVTLAGGLCRAIHAIACDSRTTISHDLPTRLAEWLACYDGLPAGLSLQADNLASGASREDAWLGGRAPGSLTPVADGYLPRIGGSSSGFRAHANRERILDAVARITAESGSATLTGQAIIERAQVPENVFRAEFKNAKGAFMAALELGHLKCQAVVERAHAEAGSWPDAVGASVEALFEFLAAEPCFTRLAFIDASFAWPMSAGRAGEHAAVYTRVLFAGAPRRRRQIAIAPSAATHSLIELAFRAAVTDRLDTLPAAAPQGIYLALAPFLGAERAAEAACASAAT